MLTFTGTRSPLNNLPSYNSVILTAPYSTAYLGAYSGISRREGSGSHPGVDIAVKYQPVFAIANGVVVKAKRSEVGFGNQVVICHDGVPKYNQVFSCLTHLRSFKVKVGDLVFAGEEIGTTGNSGASTGPHIHFQLDLASAGFHPFWPFCTAEMKEQGLANMKQAVDAKLGYAKAKQHTLSPLKWVQKYRNYKLPQFTDITRSKHRKAILELQKLGFISGSAVGKYQPKAPLTRAAAVKIAVLAITSTHSRINVGRSSKPFPDCSTGEWFTPFVTVAKQKVVISGRADGLFHPAESVSRAEFIKMAVAASGIKISRLKPKFSDVAVSVWYAPFVATAVAQKWLPWRSKKLQPSKSLTREEAAEIAWRVRKKLTAKKL